MKIICTFLVILSLLGCYRANAQTSDSLASVRGMLIDSLTGKPVPFATVSLNQQTTRVTGTLTDSLGHFVLTDLTLGTYSLGFSAVGYRSTQLESWKVTVQKSVMEVGTIRLGQDVKNLRAVTVRGQKPLIEQLADGILFNVESLPTIAGSDASDVLRKVPLLAVDANGGLSMRGNSRIRVFIDGKPSDVYGASVAEALKSIPGETIVSVEVITHPSARYDAEGTDGVVNIVTRKFRTNLTNGTLSGVLGNRSESLMGNMQHQSGPWLLKLDGFFQPYWNRNGTILERESAGNRFVQRNESRQTGNNVFGGASILYRIDSLNTVNVGYRIRQLASETSTLLESFTAINGLMPSFQRQINTPTGTNGHSFQTGYTHLSTHKRRELSLLGSYVLSTGSNRYEFIQPRRGQPEYRENYRGQTTNRDLLIQVDYSRTFTNSWKWEAGGKLTRRSLSSDSRFGIYAENLDSYTIDPLRTTTFTYLSTISALYSSLNIQLKSWQFVTGFRYERTALNGTFQSAQLQLPPFQNLVPNLLISRKLSANSTLKLGYTVRLARPQFAALNPTVNNSDSLNVLVGNPYLRPEITRRYHLNYGRNAPRFFTDVVLFYNDNRNSIESIRSDRPKGIVETTWQNIGQNKRLGLSVSVNGKPSPKFSLGTTLTAQYAWLESPALSQHSRGWMPELVLNGSYKFAKGYSVDVYGFFNVRSIQLQGYRTGWRYYNLNISKKSRDDRFILSLRLDMILPRYFYVDEVIATTLFWQRQTTRYQNQNIRLTFSYKLNKKDIKSPPMRQVETPE